MVILLTGASGFIGRHLAHALTAAGHEVIAAVRDPGNRPDSVSQAVAADFTKDFSEADWLPRLAGVDVAINAVGIIREHGAQTFNAIHSRAPRALFAACAQAGVRRIIQISALGADAHAQSRYHLTKKEADDFLASLPVQSLIIQPSLVYGQDGASAHMFNLMASLPLIPLPGSGQQQIQPVHVDDVVATILALLEQELPSGTRLAVAGPLAMSLRDFLAQLRQAMGLGAAHFMPVPGILMRLGALAGKWMPGALLDPETLQMLERGNIAGNEDNQRLQALLGRQPRPVAQFIPASTARDTGRLAKLDWLLPVLRISIALVWIITSIVSLGLYPVEDSYALLARVGITGMLAPLMLYGAALLDLAFGIAILVFKKRYWLWLAQLAVILFYTLIISWKLPEFWLHPYGPLLKNLPMLAAIWLLFEWEKR
ncbi:NAD(P)H-binding protein [Oxalobacteraceae bacterium R-40]|uniref:NAD(P)H-binding protein n=1 Tax=Keguizhuia sedimenti TaxID=3064264 RepID=A0ABU1BK04_9BURK|nr:NAD(P)H-binding protein [Oxalobacteraceae bacterium R-40]